MASACPLYMFSYRRFTDFRDFNTVWHGSQAIQNLFETENWRSVNRYLLEKRFLSVGEAFTETALLNAGKIPFECQT